LKEVFLVTRLAVKNILCFFLRQFLTDNARCWQLNYSTIVVAHLRAQNQRQ